MKHFEIRHEDEWCEVIQHSTTTHIKIDVDQLYNGYYKDGFMEFAIERIRDILGSDRVSTKNVLRAIEETDYRISDLAKDCANNFIENIENAFECSNYFEYYTDEELYGDEKQSKEMNFTYSNKELFEYDFRMMLLEFFNVLESEEDLKIDKELLTTQLAVYRLSV